MNCIKFRIRYYLIATCNFLLATCYIIIIYRTRSGNSPKNKISTKFTYSSPTQSNCIRVSKKGIRFIAEYLPNVS